MDDAFGRRRARRRPSINITPLIDVMLLLLIFVMVSSTFRQHLGVDITLPKAATAEGQDVEPHEIGVRADGTLLWAGEDVTPEALRAALDALIAESPEALVTLRADEQAPFQDVLTAIDITRSAGGARLIIPTREGPPAGDR